MGQLTTRNERKGNEFHHKLSEKGKIKGITIHNSLLISNVNFDHFS